MYFVETIHYLFVTIFFKDLSFSIIVLTIGFLMIATLVVEVLLTGGGGKP